MFNSGPLSDQEVHRLRAPRVLDSKKCQLPQGHKVHKPLQTQPRRVASHLKKQACGSFKLPKLCKSAESTQQTAHAIKNVHIRS